MITKLTNFYQQHVMPEAMQVLSLRFRELRGTTLNRFI